MQTTSEILDQILTQHLDPVSPGALDALSDSPKVRFMYAAIVEGFPDARLAPIWRVVDGTRAVVGGRLTGTNLGVFRDRPATGRTIDVLAVFMFECAAGRVVDLSVVTDSLEAAQQLGIVDLTLGPKACQIVAAEGARAGTLPE